MNLNNWMDSITLHVPEIINRLKQNLPPDKHERLDNILQRYLSREVTKDQLSSNLSTIVGKEAVRRALISFFPDLDLFIESRKLLKALVQRDAIAAEHVIHTTPHAGAMVLMRLCANNEEVSLRWLLVRGADLFLPAVCALRDARESISPRNSTLDVANEMSGAGHALPGSAAALIILEADSWSLNVRQMMQEDTRKRAEELAWVGAKSILPNDTWSSVIIPRVLRLEFGVVPNP